MNQPNQVARLLRERRAKLGLSRPQLAARSGISHETIEKWEQGRRRPSLHDAMRLAHALGIPSYELAAATLNVSGNETGGPEISPQAARSLLETTMLVFDWDLDEAARIAGATADDVDLWLRGEGDLRMYAAVQVYAIVVALVMLLIPPRYARTWDLAIVAAFYGLAKLLETFDPQIFALDGGLLSGHTLKHLAAAMAGVWLVRMVWKRQAV